MNSDHLWVDEKSLYPKNTVEDYCNEIFEENVSKEILITSKECVLKSVCAFICEEIENTHKLDEKEQNVWRRWLEKNKQIWGHYLNFGGHTSY